jgi:hypothetical protein
MRPRNGILSLVLTAVLVGAGCNGGSNDSPTMASGTGRLAVQMTDASTDLVSSVNVYVTGVTVKSRTGAVTRIANDVGLVDVLQLKGTTRMLVDAGVPAGDYEFVQIEIDQARSNVVLKATGATAPLLVASQEIKVLGGFTVEEGGSTTVTLDFKADQSLKVNALGDWMLTPVILQLSVQVGS